MLWTPSRTYQKDPYKNEADLEQAILTVRSALFGPQHIYIDVKQKIGAKGKTNNIPDGYLIDLSSAKHPRLYVVENELARHHLLKHMAVQILEFSLSFESAPQMVKSIIKTALEKDTESRTACHQYATNNGFEDIDYLLEQMIYKGEFTALVIIDEVPDELETLLVKRFKFGVEVLTLTRYRNDDGDCVYEFEPFLADVSASVASTTPDDHASNGTTQLDTAEIDTVVVPAQEDGFQETAVGEQRWYSVRLHGSMIPKIKHIAFYRVAPVSAITHVVPVQSIEPWENTNKYVLNFAEAAKEIPARKLVPNGKIKAPQNLRYTSYNRLMQASNLDEAF